MVGSGFLDIYRTRRLGRSAALRFRLSGWAGVNQALASNSPTKWSGRLASRWLARGAHLRFCSEASQRRPALAQHERQKSENDGSQLQVVLRSLHAFGTSDSLPNLPRSRHFPYSGFCHPATVLPGMRHYVAKCSEGGAKNPRA